MRTQLPQSVDELRELLGRFRSLEASEVAGNFEPTESDVFIATFAKSGTTWMQQVVHQLRCNGDDQFDDIYEVVPWLESAIDMGIDPATPQRGDFRAFKSHLAYEQLPKSARYISVLRDPVEVIPSWYRFLGDWFFDADAISIDVFAREFYFKAFPKHLSSMQTWLTRASENDTLVLTYEDMIDQPTRVAPAVGEFLGLKIDDRTMRLISRYCSREYMYENRSKFEEKLFRRYLDKKLNLPEGADTSKVHRSPSSLKPSADVVSELDALWQDSICDSANIRNYQQLRNALPNPLSSRRPEASLVAI